MTVTITRNYSKENEEIKMAMVADMVESAAGKKLNEFWTIVSATFDGRKVKITASTGASKNTWTWRMDNTIDQRSFASFINKTY